MRLPALEPRSSWRPTLPSSLPEWPAEGRVGIDVETRDPDLRSLGPGVRRGAYVVGYSFAVEDGPSHYVPIRHEGGDNVDAAAALSYLKDQASRFRGVLVGANMQYDLDFLAEAGIEFRSVRFFRDVQVADPLICELHDSYSLESIAGRYGMAGKDETHLRSAAGALGVEPKLGIWKLPARHVGEYAEQDAVLPLRILRRQEREIEEQDLWKVYDLESRLLPILLAMRRRGVRIDFDELDRVESWAREKELQALEELNDVTGLRLTPSDTSKAKALEPAFSGVGVELERCGAKGNLPSIDKDLLDRLDPKPDGPALTLAARVARLVRSARKFNKLRTSFVQSRREHAINGRIHPTFNQLRSERPGREDEQGARYGRLSCTDPNLQQEPARDSEIGPRWRSVYIPEEGQEWACLDISQQEPRWTFHYAELLNLPGAKEVGERYRRDPSTDSHSMTAELTGLPRRDAKDIFLGLAYGMGGAKFCRKTARSTKIIKHWKTGDAIEVAGDEAQALLDEFDRRMPFLKALAQKCMNRAKARGYIKTAGGRRCRFPIGPRGYEFTHKALNRLIQGSSGDQMKVAMARAAEAGYELRLQVHDELDLSISGRRRARDLAEIMRTALPSLIPFKVDIEVGPSWGRLEKIKEE